MHETPACSIHQRARINIIAPCDQFQRIQISAELRRWLLKTIRHYSRLFATIRTVRTIHYSLFPLFVLSAVRYSHCSYYSLFATLRYWLFATIRCSLFTIRDYSLFAIRVFQTPDLTLVTGHKVARYRFKIDVNLKDNTKRRSLLFWPISECIHSCSKTM